MEFGVGEMAEADFKPVKSKTDNWHRQLSVGIVQPFDSAAYLIFE